MLRLSRRAMGQFCFLLLIFSLVANFTWAQSETATVSGQVVDPSGLNVTGAQVKLVDIDRDTMSGATTNSSGLYTFPSVRPGRYRMEVTAAGFKVVNVTDVTINVQDHLEQNFKLVVGSISESMTVTADAYSVNTTDATVSTVVDRNFAENLPMNGRSFQTLIQLTPGVVLTTSNSYDSGQFSTNGQRASSNYWTVDGVSANIGMSAGFVQGNGAGGALGGFSAQGGTNSLVSVDALQEFRIQTSTYAPEFGRTPGAQISIVTRSGTNQFHAGVFDYLRNDVFDANDWFGDNKGLAKPQERQNDFGGTFSGPLLKDRTFFFFSYEGLRLRLPQVQETTVPSITARKNAVPAMQAFLNAFPLPAVSAPDTNGVSPFNASFSDKSSLDAASLRIDHRLTDRLSLFGRYNDSPSNIAQRGQSGASPLSTVYQSNITTQTATVGAVWSISPMTINDLRFNYSRTNSTSLAHLDNFGGAVPLPSLFFPTPFTAQNSQLVLTILSLQGPGLQLGQNAHNLQRQINIVDSVSAQRGRHSLKLGFDFRRLSPAFEPVQYGQGVYFLDVPSAESGTLLFGTVSSFRPSTLLFRNLGVFAQDTWRLVPHLTITYGLRWDVDFVPSSIGGPGLLAVTNFNELSSLSLAPAGTPPYSTTYRNVAPRIGVAYSLPSSEDRQTALRGGFGVFYDLATSETGNSISSSYPFGAFTVASGQFPLDATTATPPPITPASLASTTLYAFDPHLKLPYTLQWNMAVEQTLGGLQTLTASYIGAVGHRLIQSEYVNAPNLSFGSANLVGNAGESNYEALQLQFQRRLSHGLEMLSSYAWSHSIDTASAGSALGNAANGLIPTLNPNANRGPSDFDIRNAFSVGVTYNIPVPNTNGFATAIARGWSLQSVIQARSAAPVNVYDGNIFELNGASAQVRPDPVPGQAFYLHGSQCASVFQALGQLSPGETCPGGMGFNPGAFTPPPTDANGDPLRQGYLGRNELRGFGATQWDFGMHREFPIREALRLQFRVEAFNVLNHPNFGQPSGSYGTGAFGLSTQMLGQALSGGNVGGGAFSPLYQIGGPRSLQLALKLDF